MIKAWQERLSKHISACYDSEIFTAKDAEIDDLRTENESLRAECGVRQITGYNKGKAESAAEIEALKVRVDEAEKLLCAARAAIIDQHGCYPNAYGHKDSESYKLYQLLKAIDAARGQGEG